jgi:hypothetical protein
MEHICHIDDDVIHQFQEPQGRDVVEVSHVYTIPALLPIEADGRPRYRINSQALLSRQLGPGKANAIATQIDSLRVSEVAVDIAHQYRSVC